MKSRQEIKALGKQAFQANYWNCVLAGLVVFAIMSTISAIGNIGGTIDFETGVIQPGPLNSLSSLASLFVTGPLNIGLCIFFLQNLRGNYALSPMTPVISCQEDYVRKLCGYLWMMLWTFLWMLLFIIPGIIKALSYGMTQYILADCPNVRPKDALKLSMRMMEGRKAELFLFFLSFIGWGILALCTAGIVGIFYASPYLNSSLACWYTECRDDALRRGVVTVEQLEGIEPVL